MSVSFYLLFYACYSLLTKLKNCIGYIDMLNYTFVSLQSQARCPHSTFRATFIILLLSCMKGNIEQRGLHDVF